MAMRRILLVLGLIAIGLPLAAQSADTIIKREEARLAALKSGKGREQFYSRDYVTITPPGQVTAGYQPGDPNPALYFRDIKVLAATPAAAVVTLLQGPRPATAPLKSNDPDRFVDVWANEQGTWRLVARQGVWVRPAPTDTPSRVKIPNVAPYQPKTAIEGEIFKANQAIEDAFARHDAGAYERLALPEFVRIGDYGTVTTRAEWIKTNITGNKDARVVPLLDDVRIRVYDDVAVMTASHHARDAAGTTPALPLRMMRAWVKKDDGWKLAATITTIVWPAQPTK